MKKIKKIKKKYLKLFKYKIIYKIIKNKYMKYE